MKVVSQSQCFAEPSFIKGTYNVFAAWLYLLLLSEIILERGAGVHCFVKQLLIDAPIVSPQQTFWRRTPFNQPEVAHYDNFTLALTRSLEVPTPSYVQILKQGSLSITSFSLLRRGSVMKFDLNGVRQPRSWDGQYLWPNELSEYRDRCTGMKITLVADGFLMPGQDDGGIYAIVNADQDINAQSIRITQHKRGWFYHRAMYVVLPNGNEGILTARARKTLLGRGAGELVWLHMPPAFAESAREFEGEPAPWEETILETGPDVMFEVLDMDTEDDCVEIISAHFFGKKLSIHSLRGLSSAPHVEIVKSSYMPTEGRPYGLCLATFTPLGDADSKENSDDETDSMHEDALDNWSCQEENKNDMVPSKRTKGYSYHNELNIYNYARPGEFEKESFHRRLEEEADSWKFYAQDRKFKSINKVNRAKYKRSALRPRSILQRSSNAKRGSVVDAAFCDNQHPTHILVTTHECNYDFRSALNMAQMAIKGNYPVVNTAPKWQNADTQVLSGGSLFAYALPTSTETDVGSVREGIPANTNSALNNQHEAQSRSSSFDINTWKRTTICSGFKVRGWGGIFAPGAPGFPYVFRMPNKPQSPPLILLAGDCTGSAYVFAPVSGKATRSSSVKTLRPGSEEVAYSFMEQSSLEESVNLLHQFSDSEILFHEEPRAKHKSADGTGVESDSRSLVPNYELVFEIECGATVGSATVSSTNDGSGDVYLYIPAYELNKVHVFRLSDKDLYRQ